MISNHQVIENTIAMIERLDEPWGIKDSTSNHLYMNMAALRYTNTPDTFDVEGKLDNEFPTEWSELADDLQEHDRLTAEMFRRVTVIETHYWNGNSFIAPYISEKIPLFGQSDKCIGTLWNAREVHTHSPLIYINQQKPSILTTQASVELFKTKELHVIFLLLQNLSCKDMAKILNVSHRTIEARLNILYQKSHVHSMHQLKEFCRSLGLDKYIPESLLSKGIQFI
ncbi:LuxR family transcriptional regulator [Serratia sp. M24T3]|uniref:helix-turn-helix transcriptional regulator n=1 Tax=Serratia sp. M24T3 TaxID=932213 RepID=UPI00025B956A|nr:LuxR family transcriptional regulator [Serratia sp. M24T3]